MKNAQNWNPYLSNYCNSCFISGNFGSFFTTTTNHRIPHHIPLGSQPQLPQITKLATTTSSLRPHSHQLASPQNHTQKSKNHGLQHDDHQLHLVRLPKSTTMATTGSCSNLYCHNNLPTQPPLITPQQPNRKSWLKTTQQAKQSTLLFISVHYAQSNVTHSNKAPPCCPIAVWWLSNRAKSD